MQISYKLNLKKIGITKVKVAVLGTYINTKQRKLGLAIWQLYLNRENTARMFALSVYLICLPLQSKLAEKMVIAAKNCNLKEGTDLAGKKKKKKKF